MQVQPNSRYLTLALNVRKLTDSLITLVEEGIETAELERSVKEVLASLESAGGKTSVRSLRERGAFGQYENVVTIKEVVKAPERAALIGRLQDVISKKNTQERSESAIEAIEFFDALERRALYHYKHPHVSKREVSVV